MRSKLAILSIIGLSFAGCGTFSDAICGPLTDQVYYRGVAFDVGAAMEGGPAVLAAADIPFSAVADTVMVPYLAYHKLTDPPRKNITSGDGPVY